MTDKDKNLIDPNLIKQLQTVTSAIQQQQKQSKVVNIYNWLDKLDKTKNGLKASSANLLLILNNDDKLKGLFAYDEFTQKIMVTENRTIKEKDVPDFFFKKGVIDDKALNMVSAYVGYSYRITYNTTLTASMIETVATMHPINPIKDYMNEAGKNWDGKERIGTFLAKYLGAQKSEYNKLCFKLWLEGGVAKVYDPYVKFDYCLDLVGDQGTGKTYLLHKIAPLDLYTDSFNNFVDKDEIAKMRGALIANDDEMAASDRSSFAEVKRFITLQDFTYRPVFGHYLEQFHKAFILARTSNEIAHLKDKSGDRRFLSVVCRQKYRQVDPVGNLKEDEIKQLWGEAVNAYHEDLKNNKLFKLTPEQHDLIAKERDQFVQSDDLEEALDEMLANEFGTLTKGLKLPTTFVNDKVAKYLNRTLSGKDRKELRYLMAHKGFKGGQQFWNKDTKKKTRGYVYSKD